MVKLLVAGVLVLVMGVAIARMNGASGGPTTPQQAQAQVNKARQDINSSMAVEAQHAADLNNVNPDQPKP